MNKVSDSKNRIMEIMNYYGISQAELCRRTGIATSAMSNYLNGDRVPRQDAISMICEPFNINPSWLMGYDLEMKIPTKHADEENRLIRAFRGLSKDGMEKVIEYAEMMRDKEKADLKKDSVSYKQA